MENYADPVDRASVEQQRLLEENIRAAKATAAPPLPAKGFCYNCDEPLSEGERFCDKDCRDDHEQRLRSRRQRGL